MRLVHVNEVPPTAVPIERGTNDKFFIIYCMCENPSCRGVGVDQWHMHMENRDVDGKEKRGRAREIQGR